MQVEYKVKISIIIPVFNDEVNIFKCIKSILSQDYNNFEIIIINNGSTDNTYKLCEFLSKNDNRIKLLNIKESNLCKARNLGIKYAAGEYLAFVDSDDWVDKKIYIETIEIMEKDKKIDFLMYSYNKHYRAYVEKEVFPWNDGILDKKFIINNLIPRLLSKIDNDGKKQKMIMGSIWRCIFKRSFIKNHRIIFNEIVSIQEDLLFIINSLIKSKRVYITNKCYYFYNKKNEFSITNNYICNLDTSLSRVDNEILKLINNGSEIDNKNWYLRKLTNEYIKVINECNITNNITLNKKIYRIKQMLNKNKFKIFYKKLSVNEMYGLKKLVIFCLKYKLILILVIYFNYLRRIFKSIKIKNRKIR
ncbi:glycosyltransferase family 2 protein [Clostridium perfringens]|nr:glycosyltransferase family 2 protein [Clostridium perfringens]